MVAQEVSLVPQRTVAENVFLGAEPRRFGFVRRRELLDRFRRVVAGAGFEVPANATVGALPLAVQQQVEILRALAREAELIVFDEPTAALSASEIQRFHEIVRGLSASGRTVILVSHFLGEVLELADTVTILRDGQVVRTGPAATRRRTRSSRRCSAARSRAPTRRSRADRRCAVALSVRELSAREYTASRSRSGPARSWGSQGLSVRAARRWPGRSSARFRSAPRRSCGFAALAGNPRAALNARVALIPESRKDDGLMLRRPVRENVSLASVRRLARFGFVRRGSETERVRAALASVSASSGLETAPEALSGGNQQKLMFARALLAKPSVLLADDPTRGVDVGAKRDLYQLIVELAAGGVGILLISNEIEEILGLAHRVLVMRGGRIVAELSGDEITEEAILAASFGRSLAAAG